MLFTSLTYILFFAVFFGAYWSLRSKSGQNLLLLVAGYLFYGWWDWRFCSLMMFSSIWDYAAAQLIHHNTSAFKRRTLLLSSVGVNLGILGFFKYANFFSENLQAIAKVAGWQFSPLTLQIILPVGISFYTFQSISYVVDVYRREIRPCTNAIHYFTFVAFFPQLMAGPIERARHMLPQFASKRAFNPTNVSDGCRQFLWGFFKKMVIADGLGPIADQFFNTPTEASGGELLAATLAFSLQIYCDFSAYSDIALGSARMLGFDLMRNFAYPYFSDSPAEFWRRWHISLSTWFRDYIYIPLGGSRVPTLRRRANILLTFLISGFWHGSSWNFVVWGGFHGIALLPSVFLSTRDTVDHRPGTSLARQLLRQVICVLLTFIFICTGWIIFRAHTLSDAVLILTKIAINPFSGAWSAVNLSPLGSSIVFLSADLLIVEWLQRDHGHPLQISDWPQPLRWLVYSLLFWAILFWGAYRSTQFIYFQF